MFRACGILLFLLCFWEELVFAIFRSSSWTAELTKTPSVVPFSKQLIIRKRDSFFGQRKLIMKVTRD